MRAARAAALSTATSPTACCPSTPTASSRPRSAGCRADARPGGPRAGQQRRRLRGRLRADRAGAALHRPRRAARPRRPRGGQGLRPAEPAPDASPAARSSRQAESNLAYRRARPTARSGSGPSAARRYAARALPRASRSTAASTPLTKPGASAPQNALAVSTASSIAPSAGIGALALHQVRVEHLEQRGAQDRALQRGDPAHAPALGVAADLLVERVGVVGGRVRERARERRRVALEHVVERAPGEVVLVQREDRRAALIGPSGQAARLRLGTCRSPSACPP